MASEKVSAASIEAQSFPELAQQFRVRAVPHSVVNDKENVVGAVPEGTLLAAIQKVL
jgi:predicted DsbA family dithiol-disulfide isomerase